MKKISAVIIIMVASLLGTHGFAQTSGEVSVIKAYPLLVTFNKTTSLVFPYAVTSVDRGSRDILVQKANGVENVLQVKAAKHAFPETSLTVITADGSLYSYLVNYADFPAPINLRFNKGELSPAPVAVFAKDATNDQITLNAEQVATKEKTITNLKDKSFDMLMQVTGIYVRDSIMYFQFHFCNNSAIGYDIQSLRFFICDKKKSRRTASQEIELQPEYIVGNDNRIQSKSEQTISIALSKFTIPNKKYLLVQLIEKDGGRNLSVKINNSDLMRAKGL